MVSRQCSKCKKMVTVVYRHMGSGEEFVCWDCTGSVDGEDIIEYKEEYTLKTGKKSPLFLTPNTENAEKRKQTPLYSGVIKYFPDALLDVSRCSFAGNEQHHPDEPLHWDKDKSTDELDALMRHLIDVGAYDDDGIRHSTKVAWRSLAHLQREIEADQEPQEIDAMYDKSQGILKAAHIIPEDTISGPGAGIKKAIKHAVDNFSVKNKRQNVNWCADCPLLDSGLNKHDITIATEDQDADETTQPD